ncbi:MAG: universal stress protein [Bacteroidota bacterium]
MKKLERTLSLPYVVAIAIGGMLGSGIFVLPGIAAAKTGPSIWMAYLLSGLCVLPAALSKSELATAMPTSGGTYIYLERVFGPLFGTISGFGLWFSLLLKSSFALVGVSAYLFVLANVPLKVTSLVLLFIIIGLNIMGVKKVGLAQLIIVSISLLGLIAVSILGVFRLEPANLEPAFTEGMSGFIGAIGFVFVSYAGVTKVAAIAEEVKNPGKNLPRAILLALILIGIIYGSVVFVLVGNIPIAELSTDLKPIHTLFLTLGGPIAGTIAAVLGVITLSSMANSGVLSASRFPFAMSRDHLLPPAFHKVSSKFLTPYVCILVTGALMACMILFLPIDRIVKLASAFMIMMFVGVNASVILLRETGVEWYKPEYRAPFYPWIQIFGIVSGGVLIAVLGGLALIGAVVITLAGILVYQFYGKKHSNRKGIWQLYGLRSILGSNTKRRTTMSAMELQELEEKYLGDTEDEGEAAIVVPLFGNERSPEMLTEIASALKDGEKVQVVHLTEAPEQTMLTAMIEDNLPVQSLNRRLSAMAEEKNIQIEFDTSVTHELLETVQAISERTDCQWMVMGISGRLGHGSWIRNPIKWLLAHLDCNLGLFRDAGVRYIREILVYPEHNADDLLVTSTSDHLASIYNAQLTFVRVLPLEASEQEIETEQAYIEQLGRTCDSPTHFKVIPAKDESDTIMEVSAGYDLLVMGMPKEVPFFQMILGSRKDDLFEKVACSVLELATPKSGDNETKK